MTEGLSHIPDGFAIEDGTGIAIHPERNGIESFLRDAGEIGAFREEAGVKKAMEKLYAEDATLGRQSCASHVAEVLRDQDRRKEMRKTEETAWITYPVSHGKRI